MARNSSSRQSNRQPEKKFGPYPGGISVPDWLNDVETDAGTRQARNVTTSPRRYRDPQSGDWRDGSFRPSDIPALLFGLQQALEFIFTHPISGQEERDGDAQF